MARRLKSILKSIRWSLLIRAAVLGAVWLFLPFWVFILTALYLYFIPIFQPFRFFFPFLLILFLAATGRDNFLLAILFAAAFYMLLGIKDLILINRRATHEILTLLLLFLLYTEFFSRSISWTVFAAFVYSIALAVSSFLLIKGFLGHQSDSAEEFSESGKTGAVKKRFAAALSSFILWHISLALLFAPINFLYQSAILFVSAAVLMEIISLYLAAELTRRRMMTAFSVFFALTFVILAAARWGL